MAITIRTLTDTLPGEWESNIDDINQAIGEIVRLPDLRVLGSSSHATLVTCTPTQVDEILEAGLASRADLLRECVLVSEPLPECVRQQLDERGYSYLIGPSLIRRGVFETVDAMINQNLAYEDRMVSATMRALTLIARTGGVAGVLSELSRSVDGWAVLLDSHGQVIESVGAARLHIEDAVAVVLNRAVRIRYPDLQVHTVGGSAGGEHAARLVLASRLQSAYRVRTIAAHAAALLALVLRTTALSESERYARELMLDTLIHRARDAPGLLKRWKVTEPNLGAFMLSSKTRNIDVERLVSLWFDRAEAPPLYVADAGEAYGFATVNALEAFAGFAEEFRTGQGQRVSLGLGEEMPVDELGVTLKQAEQAHKTAVRTKRTVLRFAELLSVREKHLELTDEQRATVVGLLDPITLSSRGAGDLIQTLQVFLANHGSWTPTARELGIHRHTLINRVRQIEELIDMSLANPDHRTLLWLALRSS